MFLVNSVWTKEEKHPQNHLLNSNYTEERMKDMLFDDFEIAMKVVIVGNGSVGKSSMIQRFCRGIFTRDYKKTIGVDFLERVMTIDDQSVRLMLWDTAGQEEFDAITRTYYRGANACVLACSVTDKESFLALPKWKNKVCRECGDIPMVLVANKIDLQKQAVVDNAELEGMARSLGIPKLFKTSVKDDLNVNCVFTFLSTAYVHSVLAQASQEDELNEIGNGHHTGHLEESDDIDLVLNHKLNAPLFGGKNNKGGSNNVVNNNKALISKSNGISSIQQPSNKMKNGGGGSRAKNFFNKNPVILKSTSANLNHNNQNSSSNNNRGFFSSSNKKQNNNQNSQSNPHHYNFFKSSSNKVPFPNGNGGVALEGNNYHHSRNGQIVQSYRHHNAYSHYVNGGIGISLDPNRWTDTNVPFRLDLAGGKKRKRDSCTIL